MTLFVATPKRVLAINDAYIIALTFLIFFAVGQVLFVDPGLESHH